MPETKKPIRLSEEKFRELIDAFKNENYEVSGTQKIVQGLFANYTHRKSFEEFERDRIKSLEAYDLTAPETIELVFTMGLTFGYTLRVKEEEVAKLESLNH